MTTPLVAGAEPPALVALPEPRVQRALQGQLAPGAAAEALARAVPVARQALPARRVPRAPRARPVLRALRARAATPAMPAQTHPTPLERASRGGLVGGPQRGGSRVGPQFSVRAPRGERLSERFE